MYGVKNSAQHRMDAFKKELKTYERTTEIE